MRLIALALFGAAPTPYGAPACASGLLLWYAPLHAKWRWSIPHPFFFFSSSFYSSWVFNFWHLPLQPFLCPSPYSSWLLLLLCLGALFSAASRRYQQHHPCFCASSTSKWIWQWERVEIVIVFCLSGAPDPHLFMSIICCFFYTHQIISYILSMQIHIKSPWQDVSYKIRIQSHTWMRNRRIAQGELEKFEVIYVLCGWVTWGLNPSKIRVMWVSSIYSFEKVWYPSVWSLDRANNCGAWDHCYLILSIGEGQWLWSLGFWDHYYWSNFSLIYTSQYVFLN